MPRVIWMQCVIALFGGDTSKRVTATKENILKERMYEFAFEGLRYWDLLRQGVEVAASKLPKLVLCSVVAWKT